MELFCHLIPTRALTPTASDFLPLQTSYADECIAHKISFNVAMHVCVCATRAYPNNTRARVARAKKIVAARNSQ